jgi:hypothetical protein
MFCFHAQEENLAMKRTTVDDCEVAAVQLRI